MVSNKYTKSDCMDALIEAKEKLGHAPSQAEYKELDISPSYQTIANKYDRWNIAKREANMTENKPSHLKYQDGPPDILNYTDDEWNSLSKNMRFRRRNQAKVAKIKVKSGCTVCNYSDDPVALDFHHKNPKNKFMGVSTMITQGYSTDRIMDEIDKCEILCANCHSIKEYGNIYDF